MLKKKTGKRSSRKEVYNFFACLVLMMDLINKFCFCFIRIFVMSLSINRAIGLAINKAYQ